MKNLRLLKRLLFAIVAFLLSTTASFAHDFEVDGIYYSILSSTKKTVYVTYRGDKYDSYSNEYTGSVTIPETVTYSGKTYSVTSIGDNAFYECSGLTSVTIPNSVTEIGKSAFRYCSGLTSVTIPNSVTEIGDYAFYYCSGLTEVSIGNSVTSIGDWAFYECTGLTSVTIGNSVTSIGDYAFYYCSGLTEVNITDLSAWCNINFEGSSSNPLYKAHHLKLNGSEITDLIIPDGITAIKRYAFFGCSSLTEVSIPNSVTSIGDSAFWGCSGLTSVTIPNSVTSIGSSAFEGCSGLTSINVESGNSKYDSRDNCNAIIATGTNTLIVGCQNTVIPNSVTAIENYAFYGCSGLTSVTIPNSVTSIGDYAFRDCSGLTSVTIGNSVTSIGNHAFWGCSGLTSVTIPNSVTSIGRYAFWGCSGLTSVTIGNSVTSIGDSAFSDCSRLTELIILDGTETLSIDNSFTDCPIEQLYLGRNLSYNASSSPFRDKITLKELTIGNSVTSIGDSAFDHCTGLTSVTIGNSVTSIGKYAFYGCSGLTEVTIPNSVTSIGNSAFSGCNGLTELIFADGTETLSLGYNGQTQGLFYDCPLEKLYLGRNLSYKVDSKYGYSPFCDKTTLKEVTIGNYVTSIGDYAFVNCRGLTSITIPNSVTSIGYSAFYNCKNLRSVTIGNSVTSIGDSAFDWCSGLTEVTIGNSVTSIKDVFGGCEKITKLVIADGTETLSLGNSFTDCPFVKLYIGRDYSYNTTDSPFSNKKTLKEITIGNSITSIREKEFLNCIGLTSLTIGTGVLSIGTNAFSYYDNNNYSNLDIKKVIWLTNTPPQGYETVAGEVNYVANNRYSDLSNVTIYPYLSSLFEVDGIKYVPVSPSERTCDALDCSYETTISDINIGKTVSFKGIEMNIKAVKPYTFYDNTNITKATIDSEFNGSIGDYAFAYCNKIDEIILPDGVTSLGGSAFEGCSSLASVKIGSGIPALNDNAFYGCTPLSKITIPANVTSIGNNVFGNCSSLEELTITDRETELSLGSNGSNPLFSDCPLKSVYIGGNISYPTSSDYGYSPFYRNTSLETVVITDKETEISENEFYGCTALKTVYMGDGVKTIGDWAFSGCSSLDSFSFGTGMKTIGTEAFSDCTAMTKLYSKAIVPPTCGTQALDDINKWNCELYVPQASITKYQIVDQWKEFFFIKDIESGIEDVYVEEVAVTVEGGEIVVKNVTGIVTVYNLTGIAVASETADGNEVCFDNLQPGVYIVVVNNKSVKVVL